MDVKTFFKMAASRGVLQFALMTLVMVADVWDGQGHGVEGHMFSSTTRFSQFIDLDLAAGLNRYLQHETKRLEIIKNAKGYEEEVPVVQSRLKRLQELNKQVAARKTEMDSLRKKLSDFHPTTALRAVSDFLDAWADKLNNDTLYGFRFSEFVSNNDDSRLPRETDLSHLSLSLADIQYVYNLSTSDLYAGKVMGQQGLPLTPKEAYHVGLASRRLRHLEQAASWFQTAIQNTPEAEMQAMNAGKVSYPVASAMAELGVIRYGMGDQGKGLELLAKASDLDPDNDGILKNYLKHRHGRDVQPLVHSDPGEFRRHWFRLCANASSAVLTPVKWYHVCRYRRSARVPYRVYREEILSRAPFLSRVHSLMTSREARLLINASKDKLIFPAIEGAQSDLYNVQGTQLRTSVEVAALLAERISDLTGLDTTERKKHSSGEPVHVLNYGISGSFHPHYDIHRKYNFNYIMDHSGFRMASVLIYLSNVTAGGATAFPRLNITVSPQIGEALLWYNTEPSGEVEGDIVHAGCPVAVGAKWVASKGVWSHGNELRRPCGRKVTSSHLAVDKITPRYP